MAKFIQEKARELAREKLMKSGCNEINLSGIIDGIIDAELSGIKSHGFHYCLSTASI